MPEKFVPKILPFAGLNTYVMSLDGTSATEVRTEVIASRPAYQFRIPQWSVSYLYFRCDFSDYVDLVGILVLTPAKELPAGQRESTFHIKM
jgi:hypothetical protein